MRMFRLFAVGLGLALIVSTCGGSSSKSSGASRRKTSRTSTTSTTEAISTSSSALSSTTGVASTTGRSTSTTRVASASTTTTSPAPSTGCGVEEPAIRQAILTSTVAGINEQQDRYTAQQCTLASSDPSWARAQLVPNTGVQLETAVVIVHKAGGTWTVVDVGTSGVGCDTPPDVAAEIGQECDE